MCKICSDWQLGKLNIYEAAKNLEEMTNSQLTDAQQKHSEELFQEIWNDFWKQVNEEPKK